MIITTQFLIRVLIIGAILIFFQIALQMRWYRVKIWKSIPLGLMVILFGLVSSQLWFFVENLYFDGRSLYGAVFLCPLFLYPTARFLKINYGETLDFAAPAGCFVLGLAKLQCMRDGCCQGKILFRNEDLMWIRFPSQLVEFFAFVIIALFLLIISHKTCMRRKVYPLAMILYGIVRFVLDFYREVERNFVFGLSKGSFWSLASFVLGCVALLFLYRECVKSWIAKVTDRFR